MSRPPSRVDNHRQRIDLSAEHASGMLQFESSDQFLTRWQPSQVLH